MMKFLIKMGINDTVAMYFRNDYMQKYEECPDNVLDLYHMRNCNEGINSYLKDHLEFEVHLNGKGMKNIDLHVTECCIVMLAVAFTRLQHGIIENLSSVAYMLAPFLPETAEKVAHAIGTDIAGLSGDADITVRFQKPEQPLFPRLNHEAGIRNNE